MKLNESTIWGRIGLLLFVICSNEVLCLESPGPIGDPGGYGGKKALLKLDDKKGGIDKSGIEAAADASKSRQKLAIKVDPSTQMPIPEPGTYPPPVPKSNPSPKSVAENPVINRPASLDKAMSSDKRITE